MKNNEGPVMPERSRLSVLVWCWILVLMITVGPSEAAQVTLAWNPSPNEQLAGYRVRRGVRSGDYDTVFEVGNAVSFTDSSVSRGNTYFYAVSAVSVSGAESRLSRELKLNATSNKRPSITP